MKYLTLFKERKWSDGAGSQIGRRISIWAYCKLNNIQYVHNPFFKMEHNYEKDNLFEDKWEQFFNLGNGELSLDDVDLSEVETTENMHEFFDKDNTPDLYDKVRDDFRKKYFMTEKPKLVYDENFINVAVHVRRGDIVGRKWRMRKRGLTDEYYIKIMEKLNEEKTDKPFKFYVFSQNKTAKRGFRMKKQGDLFEKYRNLDLKVELMIDGCPFFDFHHLLMSDILITSKSSFPYIAGLFSKNRVIYSDFWHEPKTYWETGGDFI